MITTTDIKDLKPQDEDNYFYDKSGFLIHDNIEGLEEIHWNAAGKVVEVHKDGALYISFKYDAYGNRLIKEVAGGDKTLYISDLQGNVMATITDHKTLVLENGYFSHYEAVVVSATDYYPFGWSMPGRKIEGEYRFGFGSHEQDNEIKGYGNHLEFGGYGYDPRLGRRWNVDPRAADRSWVSPYHYTQDDPINKIDPNGELDDWVQKDGKMFYDSRVENQQDATDLYGENAIYRPNNYSYTATGGDKIVLGDQGFFMKNGNISLTNDLAEQSLAYTNPELAQSEAQKEIDRVSENYATLFAVVSGTISTDLATPDPTDLAPPKWVGYAVVGTAWLIYEAKRAREIEGIRRRAGGPQGYVYSLTAEGNGLFPVYTWGFSYATSYTELNFGEVWKYGETSSKSERYPSTFKDNLGETVNTGLPIGVKENPLKHGNQVQIKVWEKILIYKYFRQHGKLPPGNKIFR